MLIPGGLDIKEYKKEWNKQYREANREKLNEKDRKYFHDNKEKIYANRKEQITCSCGCVLTKNSLSRHKKSQQHMNATENENQTRTGPQAGTTD